MDASIAAKMPQLISLAAYSVKIWNPVDRENEIISDFDDEGADVLTFFQETLTAIKAKTLDEQKLQQAIAVTKLDVDSRTLFGIIQTGQYGFESDLINRKTARVVYKRAKDDAEMLPFFFYFEMPEGVEDGMLILQRTGALGIRKILYWVMKIAFENKHPELKLKIQPIVVESEVDRYLKGKIQRIEFVKKNIPSDVAETYDKGHKETRGTISLVVRASKKGVLPMNGLLSRIVRSREVGGVFALDEDAKFAYDNVKAQVRVGHSLRTINAAEPARIRSYFDVSESVKMNTNGHPQYNSILEQARALASNLRSVLYST